MGVVYGDDLPLIEPPLYCQPPGHPKDKHNESHFSKKSHFIVVDVAPLDTTFAATPLNRASRWEELLHRLHGDEGRLQRDK